MRKIKSFIEPFKRSSSAYLCGSIARGILTVIVPKTRQHFVPVSDHGEAEQYARYCYSVFMRHIVLIHNVKAMDDFPETVAEFGPGHSLGLGICSLLAGANKYYALDVGNFIDTEYALELFDIILDLFKRRSDIPDNSEFSECKPLLENYSFPHHVFTTEKLKHSLDDDRIKKIRERVASFGKPESDSIIEISYIAPWYDYKGVIPKVDHIFSQATLEHVDDLEHFYSWANSILSDGGLMSHQVDFKSHGITREWNGHWAVSDSLWRIIRGKRLFLINRAPLSTHLKLINHNNFKILFARPVSGKKQNLLSIRRRSLAKGFENMTDEDFDTSGLFFIAKKQK